MVYVSRPPGSMGLGMPMLVSDSVGALCTVVVAMAGAPAALSADNMALAGRTVPLASGAPTLTVKLTDPSGSWLGDRVPSAKVTLLAPLSKLPPPVAETKLVLAGTAAMRAAFWASSVPLLP